MVHMKLNTMLLALTNHIKSLFLFILGVKVSLSQVFVLVWFWGVGFFLSFLVSLGCFVCVFTV